MYHIQKNGKLIARYDSFKRAIERYKEERRNMDADQDVVGLWHSEDGLLTDTVLEKTLFSKEGDTI